VDAIENPELRLLSQVRWKVMEQLMQPGQVSEVSLVIDLFKAMSEKILHGIRIYGVA